MKRVADQVADWLVRQGVEQVFTVTGGGAMFLNQAFGSHPGLRCVYMHHEQACAMAAEGYARIAGKPAAVVLTTGPGAINAMNGVFGAFTDSIPMIVLSGQVKRETCLSFHELPSLRQLGDQEGPTIAMATSICKLAEIIRAPSDLNSVLPRAYEAAVSGRPGPVWLDIPLDIQSSSDQLCLPDAVPPTVTAGEQLQSQCQELVSRLKQADRPLILAGTGVRLSDAVEQLIRFAEQAGIPVATAWTHDLIASDHPLFAGRPGTIGTRAGNFCVQNADLLLVLGSRLNIRQTSYNWDSFAQNAWIVQVDIDPAELAKPTVRPDLAVLADVGLFLEETTRLLGREVLPSYAPWVRWCQEMGRTYSVKAEHAQAPGAALNPYLVIDRIFGQMRDDDIVVCGNASACILPFQIGHLAKDQRMFSNSGSASMGYDFPAAIGAASVTAHSSRRRIVCFAGDGSLQMNIQELQTLKTLNLNLILVVINNGGYLSIRQTHENFFGRVIGATAESGVEFPDFTAVARAYGLRAATIRSEADLVELDAFLREDGPLVLDVMVDPQQEFSPRIKSRVDENGKFVTPELDDMFPFLDPKVVRLIKASAESTKAVR